ncbi:MAG: DUF2905 domain-containing protein [Pseudomonadota bacterium]
MSPRQKTLIVIGIALIAIGFALPLMSKLGLGRLPGDIRIERDGVAFYFPVTTMLVISITVMLVLRLVGK